MVGIRYKCTVCPDFDYCEKCEKTKEHAHSFVKMKITERPSNVKQDSCPWKNSKDQNRTNPM